MVLMTIHLACEGVEVRVEPDDGSRITSMRIDGVELLVTAGESPFDWGLYPMVPYAGRVRDAILRHGGASHQLPVNAAPHSMHGTAVHRAWEVRSFTGDGVLLSTDLGPHWPFPGSVDHLVRVTPIGLACELTVACGTVDMPAQVGWHPWFRKPCTAAFEAAEMLVRDTHGIVTTDRAPAPSSNLDDCVVGMVAPPRITVDGITVEIRSDCDHWVIYDMSPVGTCIEPQSGPPNGINDDPFVMSAGATLTRRMDVVRA